MQRPIANDVPARTPARAAPCARRPALALPEPRSVNDRPQRGRERRGRATALGLTPPGGSRRIDRVSNPLPSRLARPCGFRARGVRRASGRARLARFSRVAFSIAALAAAFGCARPETGTLTSEEFDRDRLARTDLTAQIAADHDALARLISDPRFADEGVVETDPELRALARRLIERTRRLHGLSDSDVLAPGAP